MEIQIGLLTLFGEPRGSHVHVAVRGIGAVGSRPLCGHFVASEQEWRSLVDLVSQMRKLKDENITLERIISAGGVGF